MSNEKDMLAQWEVCLIESRNAHAYFLFKGTLRIFILPVHLALCNVSTVTDRPAR